MEIFLLFPEISDMGEKFFISLISEPSVEKSHWSHSGFETARYDKPLPFFQIYKKSRSPFLGSGIFYYAAPFILLYRAKGFMQIYTLLFFLLIHSIQINFLLKYEDEQR